MKRLARFTLVLVLLSGCTIPAARQQYQQADQYQTQANDALAHAQECAARQDYQCANYWATIAQNATVNALQSRQLGDARQRTFVEALQHKRSLTSLRNFGSTTGETVYAEDECIGAVVNGVCHGSLLPKSAYHTKCYGTMLNGQCTGPMF